MKSLHWKQILIYTLEIVVLNKFTWLVMASFQLGQYVLKGSTKK